ncbi:MAG: DegT/DnrJ/EryC1/StrS family aminotransferase [Candidatus Parcubacteria bacterium]|nr:DegT/DnrJ/EryC1/StrS family aminotransferase [Candidatus Parcubacteria bacterium]
MNNKTDKPILVTRPLLPPLEEFYEYLKDIWDSKWLTNNGKYHQALEKALCEYLGVKYISLFANGTLALVTALQALRITGEVITTPYSFVASTHSLWWNNIKPVFVDIEPHSFNLDPNKIEAAITRHTTAILPVHVYGNPCNVYRIKKIADTYGLKVIYDACHTFGVTINDIPVLNFGDLSVMSFHATKVYTTFEGGAIVCHDEDTKKRIDNLKNFGFSSETSVVAPGINAKMNEVQAAMGVLQLKYVDQAIAKRKKITGRYREGLKDIAGLTYLDDFPGVRHCYSYFPILIDKNKFRKTRDEVYEELKRNNIYCRRYFYPLISQFPTYCGLESAQAGKMPIAEKTTQAVLCLPLFPDLAENNVNQIINLLKEV